MMRNEHVAKGITGVSWYDFKQKLKYKAECGNMEFIEIGRFDPSFEIWSRCGWIDYNLKLSDRIFRCENCGLVIDRDLNTAINISNMELKKVGKGIPEFTPVDIATAADPTIRTGTASSRSMNREPPKPKR
ncbi:hypothetical protein [Thermoplasma volcanium GSS1]|uniref:Cas12f1-like TNB domain-containing protein n=1 Tax=Thermoplasma volcanium (strain ATCC 51530 / DSM 4299 / JCM 9571 / NBRC 15438 / GSS1) TaxID=273116 RepID=Q97AU5_THEVO|nr:hypothetical protein [Thermoplasma volcanium GSS1]